MSWSTSFKAKGSNVYDVQEFGLESLEAQKAAEQAGDLAALLVISGVVGSIDKTYKVTVSGHANPKNEPVEGWGNDFVSINVYQIEDEA